MDLPKNESTFEFKEAGETTLKEYSGRFTVLCVLNMGKKHQLELEKTRLMADFLNPSDGLLGIATILANLRIKVVEGPSWWKDSNGGLNVEDEDILVKIYNTIGQKEDEWKEAVKKKSQEGKPQGNVPVESN